LDRDVLIVQPVACSCYWLHYPGSTVSFWQIKSYRTKSAAIIESVISGKAGDSKKGCKFYGEIL